MVHAVTAVVLLLTGCKPSQEDIANGDDPVAALSATVRSTRYDAPYWAEQRRTQTPVWRQATALCTAERAPQHPNCQPVIANASAEQGNARADSVLRAIGASVKPPVR